MKDYNKIIKQRFAMALKDVEPVDCVNITIGVNELSDTDLWKIKEIVGCPHIFRNTVDGSVAVIVDREELDDGLWEEIKKP